MYDFNGGKAAVQDNYGAELAEITAAINAIDSTLYKTKESKEKTMMGKMLFAPAEINE